ncbi:ESX secretion-associated protein EspG [Nocardia speluncae]|uniref:ESX secretion-associated protein EspG n=1 Tax=Nocardia speluncae TaxID=419477 RepID=A0A846XIJ9_9NOCA|nr:ESX secretion-associated protein EspG [Nocardia speluncae]NKY33654.1 ESX secretion-associated protein EspG [Nocardia speluncae]
MSKWIWEPDDFAALWYRDGIDRFPRPLRYLSRYKTRNPYEAHAAAVRARYDRDEHELIRLALHTLSDGDLRIEILGGSTVTDRGGVREYRVVGAQTTRHGVVLAQSAIDGVDGSVHAQLFAADQLPKRLAGLLPKCAPGREAPGTFHIDDLTPGREEQQSMRRGPGEQYRRLAMRPADGGGNAGLRVGSILDRPKPWYGFRWYDITGDGRYLEKRTREHVSVRPAGPQDFAAGFAEWIDRSRHRLREEEADVC